MTINYPKYRNIHRPPHIYLNDTNYFVTTKTFDSIRYFNTNHKKELLFDVFKKSVDRFNIKLYGWVLLDNHYHLLFWLKHGLDLPKFFQNFHSNSSRLLNANDKVRGRKIWHQYQDHGIRDEKDFYTHLNYIHHNPVKHNYTKKMEDYKFSSYRDCLLKYGQEWLHSCFEQYPIIDFSRE